MLSEIPISSSFINVLVKKFEPPALAPLVPWKGRKSYTMMADAVSSIASTEISIEIINAGEKSKS